jgi:hypothetical protein
MVCAAEESHQPKRRERRRHARKRVSIPIEFHLEGDTAVIRTNATNLNLGGCFLKMMFSLEIGARLELTLTLPKSTVHVTGAVVSRFRNLGNGVHFIHIPAEDKRNLEQFLGPSLPKS